MKWRHTCAHLCKDAPKRPNVHSESVEALGLTCQHQLRSSVPQRANLTGEGLGGPTKNTLWLQQARQTEIANLQLQDPRREAGSGGSSHENVLWLQIPMDDTNIVAEAHTQEDLTKAILQVEANESSMLVHVRVKITLHKIQDKINVGACDQETNKPDHVGVIHDSLQSGELTTDIRRNSLVVQWSSLQCDILAGQKVTASIHF
mmetsp:Transcript_44449/g.72015  ORF Transcript_44449/g.72015 Transcript_44449/m.72015 type:complete len:204 (+) Transcript_44449:1179-1790(+)